MLAKRIIPCLDVKDGRVVKGTNFTSLRDAGDPIELARYYNDQGADELSFLDITASYEKRKLTIDLVKKVTKELFIPLSVGGGIKTIDEIKEILNSGAEKVSIGTSAVINPDLIKKASKKFGSQAIVVSIDTKIKGNGWVVYIRGGRQPTKIDAIQFAKKMQVLGAGEILLNSIDSDGTKKGFDLQLIKKFNENLSIPVIASGGAGTLRDFFDVFKKGKADAALAASVFHYKKYSIKRIKNYLRKKNVEVRI